MMNPPKRVTQQDVANQAGLNRATVSLAIRNHPSISLKTRERVQALAKKLGYRPDPMLSALAVYRNSQQAPDFRGTLGWLARSTPQFQWRKIEHFQRYLAGAQRQADNLGYRIQVIDLEEQGLRWQRAATILRAQGVQGLLLCPQPTPDTKLETVPWDEFSAVKFGYSVTRPQLPSVAAAQYRASQQVVAELKARGYRRIGFIGKRSHDERTGHNYFGGFLAAQTFDQWQKIIPPLWLEADNEYKLAEWLDKHRPDAVMVSMEYHYQLIRQLGYKVPRDLGVACPATGNMPFDVSGIREADERLGEVAVEMLVSMIQRGERGISRHPQLMLVEGSWFEGKTLRRPTAKTVETPA